MVREMGEGGDQNFSILSKETLMLRPNELNGPLPVKETLNKNLKKGKKSTFSQKQIESNCKETNMASTLISIIGTNGMKNIYNKKHEINRTQNDMLASITSQARARSTNFQSVAMGYLPKQKGAKADKKIKLMEDRSSN